MLLTNQGIHCQDLQDIRTSLKVLIEPPGTLMIKRKKERGLKRWHKSTVSTYTLNFFLNDKMLTETL